MKMIIFLLTLGMWAVPEARAAEPKPKIQVGPISKGRTLPETRRINGVYAPAKPTIEFSVTLTESMPMKELGSAIYFFDANNKLVHQTGATPEMDQTKIDEELAKKRERMERENPKAKGLVVVIAGPTTAKAGRKYYYRHVVEEQDPKWTHVVVVVGSGNGGCTARVYPKFDPKLLNFPDKANVTHWFES